MTHFKTGDRVIIRRKVRGRMKDHAFGVFQHMHTKSRAVVWIDPVKADADPLVLVDIRSLKLYYHSPSDRQRRAHHATRLYKQGIRWFRLESPTGPRFLVTTMDLTDSIAVGVKAKRKTVQIVKLHDLFPEVVR